MPVFTRPDRANRSRSSTSTSTSGAETPPLPLPISDGYSSFSNGSLSSIDQSQFNALLQTLRTRCPMLPLTVLVPVVTVTVVVHLKLAPHERLFTKLSKRK